MHSIRVIAITVVMAGCAASGAGADETSASSGSGGSGSSGTGGGTTTTTGGSTTGGGTVGVGSTNGAGGATSGSGGATSGSGGATSGSGGSGSGGSGSGGSGSGGSGSGGSGGGAVNSTPCQMGEGYALWRLSWASNTGYATVDAWDNGCAYSLADQACSLSGEPHDDANWGPGVVFNSSTDYFRVRFSAQGLSFSTATLYISAHAELSGIPNGVLESPIYGSLMFAPTVPISQHRTYAIDWTAFLSSSDDPNLTAVTLRSTPIGMAIDHMELCVE